MAKSRISEQTRILTKRIVGGSLAAALAFSAAFLALAVSIDYFVLPRISDTVANITSPWKYISAEVANVSEEDWYIQAEDELKADVVRSYFNELVELTVPDAGWGLASDATNAKNVQTEGVDPKTVLTLPSAATSASQSAEEATDGQTAVEVEAEATAQAVATYGADEYAPSRSQGLVQSDSLSFSAAPSASQAAKQIVMSAVDARNLGQAVNVYDAIWSVTKDWADKTDQVDLYYDEAAQYLGSDFSQVVVDYDYDANTGLETVTYAGGQQMQRDLSPYNGIKALKYPIAVALFLIGILTIMVFAVRKALWYFEQLHNSLSDVLSDRSEPVKLPPALSLAESEINDIKRRNDADERAADAAERRKNELVAYLAHDTKTPLTSITGYLTLLEEAPDAPVETRTRYAHVALEKAYRLDSMLDEFFEITRYNLGAISIERERFDLALFCYQVAEDFYPEAEARGIDIQVNATEGSPVFADARKMQRVLSNVIKNAVAYADADSVITIDAAAGVRDFTIQVSNQGREISPEHLARIFEKFYREDDARATRKGGAGLGLAIAREIVSAHGGTISATSDAGVTRFVIRIPNQAA